MSPRFSCRSVPSRDEEESASGIVVDQHHVVAGEPPGQLGDMADVLLSVVGGSPGINQVVGKVQVGRRGQDTYFVARWADYHLPRGIQQRFPRGVQMTTNSAPIPTCAVAKQRADGGRSGDSIELQTLPAALALPADMPTSTNHRSISSHDPSSNPLLEDTLHPAHPQKQFGATC